MTKDTTFLTLPTGEKLEVPYHHANNLPMIFTVPISRNNTTIDFNLITASSIHLNVADERNQNLSHAQQEYLTKHRMCSHANGP